MPGKLPGFRFGFGKEISPQAMLAATLVGVRRFELRASWSRTKRATGCATPRSVSAVLIIPQNSFYIIMTSVCIVKYEIAAKPASFRSRQAALKAGKLWLCAESLVLHIPLCYNKKVRT